MLDPYHLKPGYKTNPFRAIGNDTVEDSAVFQLEVYAYAAKLLRQQPARHFLDLGCGMAIKLKNLIVPLCPDVTGVDEPGTIGRCTAQHHFGTWVPLNMETGTVALNRRFDFIVSSDVIEHMVEPDRLLDTIKAHALPQSRILISTPNRDAMYPPAHSGPPANPGHIREWGFDEFGAYLSSRGFHLVKHFTVGSNPHQSSALRRTLSSLKARLLRTPLGTQMALLRLAQ